MSGGMGGDTTEEGQQKGQAGHGPKVRTVLLFEECQAGLARWRPTGHLVAVEAAGAEYAHCNLSLKQEQQQQPLPQYSAKLPVRKQQQQQRAPTVGALTAAFGTTHQPFHTAATAAATAATAAPTAGCCQWASAQGTTFSSSCPSG